MNIIVTGATGFIGKYLVCNLVKSGYKVFVLTRNPSKAYRSFRKFDSVECVDNLDKISAVEKIDAIINLAGENISSKRWSKKQKEILLQSRIDILEQIEELYQKLRARPKTIISASAIGYYGSCGDDVLDEDSEFNDGFTHQLCKQIEEKALSLSKPQTRICIVRFGIVLGKGGGALQKMLPAFKFGLGGKIASGKQFLSWIHIHDLVYGLNFLLKKDDLSGVFNFTSPNSVKNEEFAKTLAKTLNRPALFDMPLWLVKILFGEMGEVLLANGQNVSPKKLLEAGFKFKYPKLDKALQNLF